MDIHMEDRMVERLRPQHSNQIPPSGMVEISYKPDGNMSSGGLDPNVYATKKTIAQGMLDVALLTANASQLKYLLQLGKEQQFFHLMVSLISLSIILQVAIGVVIVMKGRYNINHAEHHSKANILNNLSVYMIFAVTVINVFVSAFGLDNGPIVVGGLFILVGYTDFNVVRKQARLNTINNTATVLVFLITVVNILIAGFGLGN